MANMLDSGGSVPRQPAPKEAKPKLASWLMGEDPVSTPNQFTETLSRTSTPLNFEAPEVQQPVTGGTDRMTAYKLVAQMEENQKVADETAEIAREKARETAEQQLGLNDPEKNKVYRMSDEEYLALTPKQRAAIDFNTALVTAVRQDKRNQERYGRSVTENGMVAISGESAVGEEQRKLYEADLESMFGSDRGSDFYAPATVALLKDIGYKNENADLDDFLNLKMAVDDKDLENFAAKYGTGTKEYTLSGVPGVQREKSQGYVLDGKVIDSPLFDQQNNLVQATQARLQELLDKGDQLLGSTYNTMTNARAGTLQSYGGLAPKLPNVTGYSPGDPNTAKFQAVFEELGANRDVLAPESLGQLNAMWEQNGVDPDTFWTYANQRITEAERAGGTLGSVGYQPDEMRKLLGLEPVGR